MLRRSEIEAVAKLRGGAQEDRPFCRTFRVTACPSTFFVLPSASTPSRDRQTQSLTICLRINERPGSECSSCCKGARVVLEGCPPVVAEAAWVWLDSFCWVSAAGPSPTRSSMVCELLATGPSSLCLTLVSSRRWSSCYQVLPCGRCEEGDLQRR